MKPEASENSWTAVSLDFKAYQPVQQSLTLPHV